MALVATQGVIGSTQVTGKLTIRFTRGISHEGVDYGPMLRDVPVTMDAHVAKAYIRRGVAKLHAPPVVEAPVAGVVAEVTAVEPGDVVVAGHVADEVAAPVKPRRTRKAKSE